MFEEVPDDSMCQRNAIGWAQPCSTGSSIVSTTPTPSTTPNYCDPNVVCTPLQTTDICTYQTNAQAGEELCRRFRTECELQKNNCDQTDPAQPKFAKAHDTRCTGIKYTVASCT